MKKIVIICDFHKNSGFGHITRMKSLANSFNKKLNDVTFLFKKNDEKFIKDYLKDIKCKYVSFSLKQYSKKIETFLKKLKVDIIIFDSYHINISLEKKLYKFFFLVSIDDKILNHNSHIVFNSKEELLAEKLSKPGKIWITGKKCILINKTSKNYKNKILIKKILIHAGGSSAYKLIDNFFNYSVKYLGKKKIKVDILFKDERIHKTLEKKIKNLVKDNRNFNFIKFDKDLSKKLKNYDVVAGPAGTTTYEALSSAVVPFSFPLFNDGRDSMTTWNLLGNITHLNFHEKNKKIIVDKMWNFIFSNYKKLYVDIKKNSYLVSNSSYRISKLIAKYFKNRSLLNVNLEKNYDSYKIKKADMKFARFFLNSRNSTRTRNVSSNPSHIITFPEHLNWWQNTDIKKFILFKNEKIPSAYLWIKLLKNNYKNIVISGWFLDVNEKDTLRTSFKVLNYQKKIIKSKYKGCKWLININKKNNLSIRMNANIGFKKASLISAKKAKKLFNFQKSKFNVYEMQI